LAEAAAVASHDAGQQNDWVEAGKTMRVLISGASGLIGEAICSLLSARRHEVCRLVRDPAKARRDDVAWQPSAPLEAARIAGFDVIVHLAGRSVATLWTEKAKAEIWRSRVEGTANLARAAAEAFLAGGRPRALIGGSAIGYYGSRGDEELVEESKPGLGFLAEVCRAWEDAAQPAAMAGVRVAQMRTALVLDASGGALARMLPAFRLGVAGKLGSGRQWWSWVSLADTARAFAFAVEDEQIHGALNLAAPDAVTNAEFTRTLGRVLHRPTLLTVPAFVLRALGGDMALEMMLASQKVMPRRLLEAGFKFEDVELEPALRKMLRQETRQK
jgi:hypothetical protein